MYSALYVAKLAAPLCVNFLMVIHYENNQETVFDKVAGRGMSWSFVSSFLRYIPCFILILCVMYFFNVYSIIMKHMDMEEYTYYNFYDPEKLEDGARVLTTERDRRSRERTLGRRATARVRDVSQFVVTVRSIGRRKRSSRCLSRTTLRKYIYLPCSHTLSLSVL